MKPALLVIIMDFLVSSLLLFIGGPGMPAEVRRPAARAPVVVDAAPEFAPAAMAEMEQQWALEYQQELAAARLATQAEQLTAVTGHARTLIQHKERLETRIATQDAQLTESQTAIAALHTERARQDEALRQEQGTRKTLTAERDAVAAQKADVARRLQEALSQQNALAEQAGQLRARIGRQEETIQQQNETITNQQAFLQRELRDLAEAQRSIGITADDIRRDQLAMWTDLAGGTAALGAGISTIQTQQQVLAGGLNQVDAKLARAETRQIGPFARFRDARVSLDFTLSARRNGEDATALAAKPYTLHATLRAPLLSAAGGTWLIAQSADLGITWPSDYHATAVNFKVLPPGTTGAPADLPGPLQVVSREPHILFLRLPAGMILPGVTPIALPGRAGLEKRGLRDIYLFKRSVEGVGAPVEVALDLSRPGYLLIRKSYRGWINFLARNLVVSSEARPEAGDGLVTAEGDFVGLMLDDTHGFILSESDLTTPGRTIPLADPAAFGREAAAWKTSLRP
ncbi:MAG: hypothetical protein WCI17_09130 [bacterium]